MGTISTNGSDGALRTIWAPLRRCLGLTAAVMAAAASSKGSAAPTAPPSKPNILWITCEDMSPNIGPYGDRYATTPNLDRFARTALRYRTVWSNAPVCAPARTCLISGMYPPATGSEHMRSQLRLPAGFRMYPQYLRDAGYYCTNNNKEDYNLVPPEMPVWDASSNQAHWKNRKPGQPFFAIFNLQITHESQIRKRPHQLVHDPAGVRVPAYHPDTPEVRHDWAQYYDNITTMDQQFGERLREMESAGLADDTIVFFYSDHGSGMPRSKRWPCNSGLQVPMLVHVPERFRHLAPADYRPNGVSDRMVGFVDLAPTLLSLAGLPTPKHFQGRAIMGPHTAPAPDYLFGFRGRMDERIDMVRTARDERYVYVRNYMPHRTYAQHVSYQFETPTTHVWKQLFDAGVLTPPRTYFWKEKPAEELYDLWTDPDEVQNLARDIDYQNILTRLRRALRDHILRIGDVGFLPEAEMHRRSPDRIPWNTAQSDTTYPIGRILPTANAAAERTPDALPKLTADLQDSDAAVRYWAATGFLIRGKPAVGPVLPRLRTLLQDESPSVRIVAAETLARFGSAGDLGLALEALLDAAQIRRWGVYACIAALNAVDELGEAARPIASRLRAVADDRASREPRADGYVPRLLEKIEGDLGITAPARPGGAGRGS